jgi:probable rRNA maturation factor
VVVHSYRGLDLPPGLSPDAVEHNCRQRLAIAIISPLDPPSPPSPATATDSSAAPTAPTAHGSPAAPTATGSPATPAVTPVSAKPSAGPAPGPDGGPHADGRPLPAPAWQPVGGPEVDLAYTLAAGPVPGENGGQGCAWMRSDGAETFWAAMLGRWLAALSADLPPALLAPAYSLGLSLVDDASIAALNASWRGKEGATDVLAFAAQEDAPPLPASTGSAHPVEPLELGDIVISLETASRQAADAGETLERELLFLASHGLLHLLGWDHPDEPSLAAMLARQNDLLALSGLPMDVSPDLCAGGFAG